MNIKAGKVIFWTPRIILILAIIFFALMSLDIFDMKLNFQETLLGLFMHNIPTLFLLIILVIFWKRKT